MYIEINKSSKVSAVTVYPSGEASEFLYDLKQGQWNSVLDVEKQINFFLLISLLLEGGKCAFLGFFLTFVTVAAW
jgi:hypothetical protein